MSDKVGSFYLKRENFRLTPGAQAKFTEKLKADPREFCAAKRGRPHRRIELVFSDGSRVCYRLSGTGPVVRVYTEARSEPGLEKLSTAAKAKSWIFE
jgi:phosphoglucomutase